ncbi:MAG: hypothetical protein EBX52_10630 [Proteobacteria bacterium]|nr:hypothetical protein [Pseudomonadota bacterium]
MKMWMIRHADLTFSRPIPEPLLISKIETGAIDRSDEICLSGGYWFSVQDVTEIRKFLGEIDLVALMGARGLNDVTSESERTRTDHVAIELAVPEDMVSEEERLEKALEKEESEKTPVPAASVAPAPAAFPNQAAARSSPQAAFDPAPLHRTRQGEDPDGAAAPGAQILLIAALVVIFCGTIALLWIASK